MHISLWSRYHGAPGGGLAKSKCDGVDFHDSVGEEIKPAAMSGPGSLNGTYDQVAFSQRAVELIHAHAAKEDDADSFYCYLAYHNVHDACIADRFSGGLNAPMETVDLYKTTVRDAWKVQAAMTTELDCESFPQDFLMRPQEKSGIVRTSYNWEFTEVMRI